MTILDRITRIIRAIISGFRRMRNPEIQRQSTDQLIALETEITDALTGLITASDAADTQEKQWLQETASTNSILAGVLENRSRIVDWLTSGDHEVRKWALIVSNVYSDEIDKGSLEPLLERMAFEEPDIETRSQAILSIAAVIRSHDDPERARFVGHSFALIVLDENQNTMLRKAAYQGLLILEKDPRAMLTGQGRDLRTKNSIIQSRLTSFERLTAAFTEASFPAGVDWDYVNSWR